MGTPKKQPWDKPDVTPGGSEVIRHEDNDKTLNRALRPFSANTLSEQDMEAISDHVERHVGKVDSVLHEIMSDDLHIDVNLVRPSDEFPHAFLCTMGMSALPMHVPQGYDGPTHAELCIFLPPKWPLSQAAFEKHGEDAYWPVRSLKSLARLPNDFQSFLGPGHTIPNGDPPEPLSPRCKFVGMLILPAAIEEFQVLSLTGREVAFFMLVPLFEGEMQLKLDKGTDALIDRFEAANIHVLDLADPRRPNVAR